MTRPLPWQQPAAAPSRPPLIDVEEAAKRLGVSKMAIYRLIEGKQLRAYRIGRSFRIDPRDLAAFMDAASTIPKEPRRG
ncbi:MAG: helix-turn-helix domain-containing protein [Mycobacteriaceae bacterium]